MATADSVKTKIQGLISKSNAKTGRSDADMTNAVNALLSGYNPNGITPSGTINITTNGTHDVKNYASANVNVPTGTTPTGTINITTNGSHNVTNYATANVNVPVGEDVTAETNTYTSLLADLEDAVNNLPEGGGSGAEELTGTFKLDAPTASSATVYATNGEFLPIVYTCPILGEVEIKAAKGTIVVWDQRGAGYRIINGQLLTDTSCVVNADGFEISLG